MAVRVVKEPLLMDPMWHLTVTSPFQDERGGYMMPFGAFLAKGRGLVLSAHLINSTQVESSAPAGKVLSFTKSLAPALGGLLHPAFLLPFIGSDLRLV